MVDDVIGTEMEKYHNLLIIFQLASKYPDSSPERRSSLTSELI
jgi:hypothetical protein